MSKIQTKIPALFGALVFAVPFFVYLVSACSTVFAGDSGELITAAYVLGVAHPPGYPLFCLLGKLFSWLPFANIAFRVNILAGFFGAGSVFMLYLFIKKLLSSLGNGKAVLIAFFTALALAFSFIFWEQALHAKGALYTLNAFFIITLFYMLLVETSPLLIGIIAGLSLANHHIVLTFIGMTFLYLVVTKKQRVKTGLVFILFMVVTAVLLYLYLPIAASFKPAINWGDPKDLESAIFHIFRGQYGSARMPLTAVVYFKKVFAYAGILISQFNLLCLLALPGLYWLYKNNKNIFWLTTVSFVVFYFPLLYKIEHNLTVHVLYMNRVFLIPLFALTLIWSASGFAFFFEKFPRHKYLGILPAIIPFFLIQINYKQADKSQSYLVYDYGVNVFRSLEKNAVLFTAGDHSAFITVYLQVVEKARLDVKLLDDTGSVFENIYGEDYNRLLKGLHEKRMSEVQLRLVQTTDRPVYFIMGSSLHNATLFNKNLAYLPRGLAYKLTGESKGAFYRENTWNKFTFKKLSDFMTSDYLETDLLSQLHFMRGEEYYYRGDVKAANAAYDKAIEIGRDSDTLQNNMNIVFLRPEFKEKMLKFTKDIVARNPNLADSHTNMGNAFMFTGDPENAILEYKKALELDPKSEQTWHNLGVAYTRKNNHLKAMECYRRSIALYPVNSGDFINLIDSCLKLDKFEEAIEAARMGIRFHQNDAQMRSSAANVFLRSGKFEEALEQYGYIIKNIDPGIPEVYNNIGVTLLRMNRIPESETYFVRALELNPGYAAAKKNLGDVRNYLRGRK